jgi:transposase
MIDKLRAVVAVDAPEGEGEAGLDVREGLEYPFVGFIEEGPKLFRGYLLKEKPRLVFQHPFAKAKEELEEWLAWAQRCRIPQFDELREKIKRHFEAILSSVKFGLSNARIEAINNKIKVSIRMAYGFRNIENMLALVMLRCSGVNLTLSGRA